MNQRVYAPDSDAIGDIREIKQHLCFDLGDYWDRSCRLTFENPSQASATSETDGTTIQENSDYQKLITGPPISRKGLKALPSKKFWTKPDEKKKKRRKHRAIKEINTYQKTVNLLIPRKPFKRLCAEIARKQNPSIRFKSSALEALQEAAEAYIVGLMEDSQLCCIHAKRVTIMQKDMLLAKKIANK